MADQDKPKKPSQVDKLHRLLADFQPHRTDEIVDKVYGSGLSLSRVGARIFDLKKRLPQGWTIKGWHDKDQATLYWYRLVAPVQGQLPLNFDSPQTGT